MVTQINSQLGKSQPLTHIQTDERMPEFSQIFEALALQLNILDDLANDILNKVNQLAVYPTEEAELCEKEQIGSGIVYEFYKVAARLRLANSVLVKSKNTLTKVIG